MSDRYHDGQPEPAETPRPAPVLGLPEWLARWILYPGETIQMVRGPKPNPILEPYFTHPAFIFVATALVACILVLGRLAAGSWKDLHPAAFLAAFGLFFGSVFIAGFASGWFTRLVITDRRLIIVQGCEVWSHRDVNQLPPALLRRRRGPDGLERSPTVDLDAVNKLLGDGYVDANTILTLGKKIDKLREADDPTERM